MQHIPVTPLERLDISTPELRKNIFRQYWLAKLSGKWKRPYQKAATSFDEMGLIDIYYWVYKCANPVKKAAPDFENMEGFVSDPATVQLPETFEPQSSLSIGAGGDLLYSEELRNSQDALFSEVADLLFAADISYANLESPVTHQTLIPEVISDRAPPTECCSPQLLPILTEHNGDKFTILNTANNHMADMGVEGVETTVKCMREAGIVDVGTNASLQEQQTAKTIERNGIKIGLPSVTFGLNGRTFPEGEEFRVNTANLLSNISAPDLDGIRQQIQSCKEQNCDFILLSMHWGYEFEFFPRKKQVEIARQLVEEGADAIVCHHPHVAQPVEYYQTKRDPQRKAIIAYSLGSLTWGYSAPHLALSIVLNLELSKGHMHGRKCTYIASAKVTPVCRIYEQVEGKVITRIVKLSSLNADKTRISSRALKRFNSLAQLIRVPIR